MLCYITLLDINTQITMEVFRNKYISTFIYDCYAQNL